MPEIRLVVEINRRDRGHHGLNDIRRVKSSTHAHFVNGEISTSIGEANKCYRRNAFKKRRVGGELSLRDQRFNRRANPRPRRGKSFVGNILTIDSNALIDSFEVWRCK